MHTLKILFQTRKYAIMGSLEYKTSFLTQIIFMMINNVVLIFVFYLFFLKFDTIGGLQFFEWAILFSALGFSFSYLFLFMAGFENISTLIKDGKLDSYLILPTHPLASIISSDFRVSAVGDFITSVAIFYLVYIFADISIYATIILLFKSMFFSLFGAFIIIGFMLIFHSLSFFIGSSESMARAMFQAILSPSMYPPQVYTGTFLKPIFMTIFPVFYSTYLPFKLITEFVWIDFLYLLIATIVFVSLGIITFNLGLKRYESGNSVNTNV